MFVPKRVLKRIITASSEVATRNGRGGKAVETDLGNWMLTEMNFERADCFSQLFVKCNDDHKIILLFAIVTDYFLCSGTVEVTHQFLDRRSKRFIVSKTAVDDLFCT